MAGTALRGRLTWQTAAVPSVTRETPSVVTTGLDPPDWPGHRAGQHLDVRLTAEDGHRAEREYSIASAPGEPLAITVERLEGCEVSPYLTEELRAGDELELRGPVGGYFIWEPGDGYPLMLLAGGSCIVPLRSILRHRRRTGNDVPAAAADAGGAQHRDRPVQVASHFHFFEVNRALEFDRQQAFGHRLAITAGTAVRFEPGDEREVTLVPYGGKRRVHGFNNLVDGWAPVHGSYRPRAIRALRLAGEYGFKSDGRKEMRGDD